MDTKALRQKILDLAIRGKLVPQNLEDEPASVLLERIRAEKEQMVKDGKLKAKDIKKDTVIFRGDDNLHYEKFADGTVKCIEDEIPFEVPEGWSWCRFSTITVNKDAERKPISLAKRQDVKKIYDYYGASGKIDKIDKYIFDEKLLLIGEDGANLTTRSKPIAFLVEGKYWVNNHAHCIDATNKFILDYLCVYINTISLEKYVTGSAQPKMTQANMNSILVPLPPYKEQCQINLQLSNVFGILNHIENWKTDIVELITETKSKILDLAIRGKLVPQDPNDEPASALLERIRAEKEELIKQGKIKRDKKASIIFRGNDNSYYLSGNKEPLEMPFEIPDSWAWSTLYEICNYGETTNINAEEIPDGAWILDLEDIEKDSGKILQKVTNKLRKSTSTKHQFRPGMVLYSKLRPYLNKVIVANESGYCTSEILPLRFVKDVQPEYAQIFLMSPYFVEYANNCSYGMKMPRLGTKDGQKAFFPVPPHKEQIKIVEFVKDATDYIDSIYNSL